MVLLVRIVLALRAAARHGLGFALALVFAGTLVGDEWLRLEPRWRLAMLALYGITLLSAIRSRYRPVRDQAVTTRRDTLLGFLMVLGALWLAANVDGNLDGACYPLLYVLLTTVSVLATPTATALTLGFMVVTEGAMRFIAYGETALWQLSIHTAFGTLFAGLGVLVLRAELARIRSHSRSRVQAEIERMHSAARSYRLLGVPARPSDLTPPPPGTAASTINMEDDPGRLVRSSVEEIHQAVMFALDLLRRSLGLQTAMLLWLADSRTQLRLTELTTDFDGVCEGPFAVTEGIFGEVTKEQKLVALDSLKLSYDELPYYDVGICPVRAVAAVPVLEGEQLRGVLVADRRENIAFDAGDQELLTAATHYMLRAIQNERVFVLLERAKVEQGKLYRAARALGAALSEREVVEASVRSAREIASFDFAAVTLFDETTETHEVRAVSGASAEQLVGQRFRNNSGLVSMVVRSRQSLPYRGQIEQNKQVVFTSRVAPPQMPSVLVLPLLVRERCLGTLVLGANRHGAFGDAVRPTLEVLASHVAVSLANARMVKRLEELATTDGLTGLYNKRAMLEMATAKVAAAKRFERPLSVLIADIDFFKKVNDTYGHDIGDVVIKGLAGILRQAKRTTDVVARFGGEEFVVVCEQTDREGGLLLAERIRETLQKTVFQTPQGEIKVTCSIGVATYPEAGQDWEALFKATDEALYVSKRGGRNRTTLWTPPRVSAA